MSTTLKIEAEDQVLVARFRGKADVAEIEKGADLVARECERLKLVLLLVDFTGMEWTSYSTLDRYRVSMSAIGFLGKIHKVAAVMPKEFVDPDKFGESVARNRGLDARVFSDEEEARTWLLQESRP